MVPAVRCTKSIKVPFSYEAVSIEPPPRPNGSRKFRSAVMRQVTEGTRGGLPNIRLRRWATLGDSLTISGENIYSQAPLRL